MQSTRWSAPTVGVAILLGLMSPISTHAQTKSTRTEELQGGRWIAVNKTAAEPTVEPALVRVEELINSGQYSAATKQAVQWLLANPNSPNKDRGLFLNAEALYRYGDRIKAFYYLDQLMDEFPESKLFYPALEKQYQIADEFLPSDTHRPVKSRFLGFPLLGREDEAIEMMYRIQQRSPGSALAEKALLRTADYYYADGQYDLAGDAYTQYARSYPRSPLLPQVKLRSAKANFAQFRGPKFDATPAIDARAQFAEVQAAYPEISQRENVPGLVDRIDQEFARKLLLTGNFYKRTHEPAAAAYLYRSVVQAYPNSPEAAEAKAHLETMPKSALEGPTPAGGAIGLPSSTQPSAE